jgi:antirestriction protein ArdC
MLRAPVTFHPLCESRPKIWTPHPPHSAEPERDYVQVPPPQVYFEPINWHRSALHELGHASGAPHRLNRDLSGSFGSKKYAFEELVAEMNAAFCCASLGIVPTVRHAD